MSFSREQHERPPKFDPSAPTPGGYRLNGSWDPDGHPTPLYSLVKELRHLRRTTNETPAELIRHVPGPLLAAFPSAAQWATLTERRPGMESGAWCAATCYTSAEAAVVCAFRGPQGQPRHYQPSDEGYAVTAEEVARLVAGVTASLMPRFEPERHAPPPTPAAADETFFRPASSPRHPQPLDTAEDVSLALLDSALEEAPPAVSPPAAEEPWGLEA